MLIIAGGIPCLGCQKTGALNLCFIAAQQHTAAGGGDDFVAVKRKNAIIPKGTKLLTLEGAPQRFRSILDQRNLMLFADVADAVDFGRCTAMTAAGCGYFSKAFSKATGSIFQVSGSESIKTGFAFS